MGTFFDGDVASNRGIGVDIEGSGFTASLEGGYPVPIVDNWVLEPQAQIIWQHLSLDDQNDGVSKVSFDTDEGFTGRLGVRLQGDIETSAGRLQPYLKANIWHEFDGTDNVLFGAEPIGTELGGTSLEIGGGVVAAVNDNVSVFAVADYAFDIGGEKQRIFEGNVGLRVKW